MRIPGYGLSRIDCNAIAQAPDRAVPEDFHETIRVQLPYRVARKHPEVIGRKSARNIARPVIDTPSDKVLSGFPSRSWSSISRVDKGKSYSSARLNSHCCSPVSSPYSTKINRACRKHDGDHHAEEDRRTVGTSVSLHRRHISVHRSVGEFSPRLFSEHYEA
jgi:hypothetical protein